MAVSHPTVDQTKIMHLGSAQGPHPAITLIESIVNQLDLVSTLVEESIDQRLQLKLSTVSVITSLLRLLSHIARYLLSS